MTDPYPWKRKREFKPGDWTHAVPTDPKSPRVLCGAFRVTSPVGPWQDVTCPRCHAERVAEIGFASHIAEVYPTSPIVARMVTEAFPDPDPTPEVGQ